MRTLRLTVPCDDAEIAADRLWSAGARAVEERDASEGRIELRTVLAADDAISLERLGRVPASWSPEFVDVAEAPEQTWRSFATPIEVTADLVIRPAWLPSTDRQGLIDIAIEPGASFGLGDHPTTRLSAVSVRRLTNPGDRVLDVGCGSGVLAIIAARCGASDVVAIDIAEAAREATDDNARRNEVASIVRASSTPLDQIDGRFDLVLANILAPTLVSLAADLRRVTSHSGSLVISGILAERYDHVLAALAPMAVVDVQTLDGWAAVELRHP